MSSRRLSWRAFAIARPSSLKYFITLVTASTEPVKEHPIIPSDKKMIPGSPAGHQAGSSFSGVSEDLPLASSEWCRGCRKQALWGHNVCARLPLELVRQGCLQGDHSPLLALLRHRGCTHSTHCQMFRTCLTGADMEKLEGLPGNAWQTAWAVIVAVRWSVKRLLAQSATVLPRREERGEADSLNQEEEHWLACGGWATGVHPVD